MGTIAGKAARAKVQSPAIILVGYVAAFQAMDWYESRPLAGRKILVTRPRERGSRLAAMLRGEGAEVLELPTIRIEPVTEEEHLSRALAELETFSWIVFTSPSGVRMFREELKKRRQDARSLAHLRIAAIGEGTAGELEAWGFYPDLIPEQYDGDHLGEALASSVQAESGCLSPGPEQAIRSW